METSSALVCVQDFETEAAKLLPREVLDYYKAGALTEHTLRENREAIKRWYIRPRFLTDVSTVDLRTSILGHEVNLPFGVAPTGMQKMAHPEGEGATARAAGRLGTVFTLSTNSTSTIEEIATETGLKFFQLYIYKDRDVTARLVQRAEESGYKALVLTVDVATFGIRYADVRNKFKMPPHLKMSNFSDSEGARKANVSRGGSGINEYVQDLFDSSLTWKDVTWLKSITSLPIVLKGILTAEDAIKGVDAGASAIWVSNHGGRQLDGVLPSIDALSEVVSGVRGRCQVYVDGGFRNGTDVFKALAIGATMVFLGRPLIWGLACGGEEGATKILTILRDELINTMKLAGFPSIRDVTEQALARTTTTTTVSKL